MSVNVPSKDVGDVRNKFRRELGCPWQLEDGIEESIKLNLGIRG